MSDRPTHGYCATCQEDSAIDFEWNCLWCGGPTQQREVVKRGGWKRPDLSGSRYSEPQLRALHVMHMRGASINSLAKQSFETVGYGTHASAAVAISREWKRMGLKPRDRIEQVRMTCTTHGLSPKHGPRPGYGTYKRRVLRGEEDQPACEGFREHPPRKGDPCEARAAKGSKFCYQHDPKNTAKIQAHLDRVHAQTRAKLAANAVPMAPFAAYVKRRWGEEGTLGASGEALGLHKSAVSVYARGCGSDKRPKDTIQRATVERVLEHDGTLTFEELYGEDRALAVAA